MAWQAGVAPFGVGAINVWSLGLSKPRADGVLLYVVLSEMCHEPLWLEKETVMVYGTLGSHPLSPPAQQCKKRELTTQGFIYHLTNNKMNPLRKESAQPYCTRVPISASREF
jgi:hypothetical protein